MGNETGNFGRYPANGVVFKLTLDWDDPENEPMAMARRDGFAVSNWLYKGERPTGIQTRRFKLILAGYGRNFLEVLAKIQANGKIPEGQWREAFKTAHPHHDGGTCVGVPDLSWVNAYGSLVFPFIDKNGHSSFHWPVRAFSDYWRWLVLAEE